MAVSFAMLGILIMLDVCFVVNCFVIRAFRRWTDAKVSSSLAETDISERKHSSDILANNFQGLFDSLRRSQEDVAFAWILGTVKLDPMRVKLFAGWKPIPYNLGLGTTCVFVIVGTILLSPDMIVKQVGVSSGALDSDLCVKEAHDEGLEQLRSHLLNVTNFDLAKRQHRLMVDFHEALVNDTALYGVAPYECPTRGLVSGRKDEWNEPGTFFPGYCVEAMEAAIHAAKHRQCTQEICDCPTLPDSAVFKVAGLANKKYCGEVCMEVPYPCPKHSAEDEEALKDYRYQQYQIAEERREEQPKKFPVAVSESLQSAATKTAEKILHQVDIASYLYIGYSCIALFFPTPLVLFRMPHWVTIKRFLFGVQKPFFIISIVAIWWGIEYFQNIWYSPDIRLFLNNLRAGDPCFVDGEYLVARQKVMNDICQELVPMEPEWNASVLTVSDVLTEVQHFLDDCECPFPNKHLSNVTEVFSGNASDIGFSNTIHVCLDAADCTVYAPDENMEYFGNASICTDDEAARRLVLEAPEMEADWYDLWVASGFLATLVVKIAVANFGLALMTLADPFVVCAGEFLWMPADFGMEIENATGQRERVTVDAFENGQLSPNVVNQWYQSKHLALFHVALSKTVLWGLLMHLSMLNLFFAVFEEIGENSSLGQSLADSDIKALGLCLGFAVLVAVLGCYVIRLLQKKTDKGEDGADDEDTDEDTA